MSHLHLVTTGPYDCYTAKRLARVKRIRELKENINYPEKYWNMYKDSVLHLTKDDIEKHNLQKTVYAFCKYVASINKQIDDMSFDGLVLLRSHLGHFAEEFLGRLTVQEFINIFPIEKRYDGGEEFRDYFSTMDTMIDEFGLDEKIPTKDDKYFNFLWEYYNPTITRFMVNLMKVNRRLDMAVNGRDSFADMLEEEGLEIYHMETINGKKYLVDEEGNRTIVRRAVPRYMRLVK